MTAKFFEGCTDQCGWVAGILAAVLFGSYGAPIKMNVHLEVDPLVMQSYKTITLFLTCWVVVLLGEEVRWTKWGLASAMFWVPGATAGIYGVRNAGIAVAVGTWSSITVISSFIWGILIFHEGVKSVPRTVCAFVLLILGLIGMSKYASPVMMSTSDSTLLEMIAPRRESDRLYLPVEKFDKEIKIEPEKDLMFCYGCSGYQFSLSRRQLGVLGAAFNGLWGGMKLIPLHYAKEEGFGGAGYLISFAIASMIVNIFAWIIYLLYKLRQTKGGSLEEAIACLPEWHLKEMCIPGLIAGMLYTLGNLCVIVAVTYLGQAVGFSLAQLQLLVGGLWGIFFYREIVGYRIILSWFGSAFFALCGIIWLSYEHSVT